MSYEIIVEYEDDVVQEQAVREIEPYTTDYFTDAVDEGIIYELGEANNCDIDQYFDEHHYFAPKEVISQLKTLQLVIVNSADQLNEDPEDINKDIDSLIQSLDFAIQHSTRVRLAWS